jgi:hypothetical protein
MRLDLEPPPHAPYDLTKVVQASCIMPAGSCAQAPRLGSLMLAWMAGSAICSFTWTHGHEHRTLTQH